MTEEVFHGCVERKGCTELRVPAASVSSSESLTPKNRETGLLITYLLKMYYKGVGVSVFQLIFTVNSMLITRPSDAAELSVTASSSRLSPRVRN